MLNEDKASSIAKGGTSNDDMSADKLLELLHRSVEKPSDTRVDTRDDAKAARRQTSGARLAIDEDVYQSAQSGLLHADEAAASDAELDIDALIEKYIRKPTIKPQEAAEAAAPSGEIVKEITRARTVPDALDDDVKVYGAPERSVHLRMPSAANDASSESSSATSSNETVSNALSSNEASVAELRPVEKLAEADGAEAERTTVFDVASVRHAAEAAPSEDAQAFTEAQTSVFTPIHSEQPESSAQTVYGEPGGEEIDQTDLNLMIAFGMNEELKETVGEQKATEIENDIQKKHEETVEMQNAAQVYEYTDRSQNNEILTHYRSSYYLLIVRLVLAVVLGLALFVVENYSLLGLTLPSFMRPDAYPVVYAMIDLQLVVLAGALIYRQVLDGGLNLILLRPTPESISAFMLIISVFYTAIVCLSAPREGFALYNLTAVLGVILALLYEFMNLKRDVFSFNVVSSKRKKFVVTPVSDETESLEREIFREYIPEDSQIIRVGRTGFVDGFFRRATDKSVSKPIIGLTVPLVMILACGFFAITYITGRDFYRAFTMAYLTVTFTLPLTTFVIYSCPFYKASHGAYECDSAIIGETSFYEYAGSSVISFEDKEVFPSGGVKVTSIKVYGSNRIDKIIYNLASAFIKVGGPLAEVFSQATHDMGHSESVELIEIDEDGFTASIDDVQVYIGKTSYMEKKDYEPPFDAEDKRIEQNTSIGILYVAYEGQLAAKVYVQYTIDNEFEQILAQLYKNGMCVGIKSFDPNIDDLLLAKKIKAMKYPVKVIRSRTVEDIPHTVERCDSGIVSKRSVKELLKTVAICERVSGVVKTNMIVKVLAMLIGVIVMVCLYSFGAELSVTSLYTSLYQLFWVIPVFLISWFMV